MLSIFPEHILRGCRRKLLRPSVFRGSSCNARLRYPKRRGFSSSSKWTWRCPDGFDTNIQVYNTLTKQKEKLILKNPKLATWYSCGPTVYDSSHLGHASSYVRFDIIRRILEKIYNIDVVMVMGITNIDDKIIHRAREVGIAPKVLADNYEQEFLTDMAQLRVISPCAYTRVTDYMPNIVEFCSGIKDKGLAYAVENGSVYFDVEKFETYGRFRAEDNTLEPSDKMKKNPRDFALWKGAKPGEPNWPTPWGKGRPGWHIECSAMASAMFNDSIDIHTGGRDLTFPHHENEEAQSCAYHGVHQWANYWLHSGQLHVKNQTKMSKSLKNTISIQEFLKDNSSNDFRMYCLRHPYRKDIDFSPEIMREGINAVNKIKEFLSDAEAYIDGQLICKEFSDVEVFKKLALVKKQVDESLRDDFDYPGAINTILSFVSDLNKFLQTQTDNVSAPRSPGSIAVSSHFVTKFLMLLGVEFKTKRNLEVESDNTQGMLNSVLDSLVRFRNAVRLHALTAVPQEQKQSVQDQVSEKETSIKNQESHPLEDKGDKVWISRDAPRDRRVVHRKEREPLIKACDTLRDELFVSGVQIKDRGKESTWNYLEDRSLEGKKSKVLSHDQFDPQYIPRK